MLRRFVTLVTPVVAWPLANFFGIHWCVEESAALLVGLPALGVALSWFSSRRHTHHAGCKHEERAG